MAIIRRNASGLQEPISRAKPFVPDPRAKLTEYEGRDKMFIAAAVYDEVNPKTIPAEDLAGLLRVPSNADDFEKVYRNRIRNRNTAIRATCVLCIGGPKKVRACPSVTCSLWPFRMGSNPFRRR